MGGVPIDQFALILNEAGGQNAGEWIQILPQSASEYEWEGIQQHDFLS